MNIYTSYFARVAELKKNDIVPISIALWSPKFFHGPQMVSLAPRAYMLKDGVSIQDYIIMYNRDILSKINLKSLLSTLNEVSQGKDVALCCYEKPSDFCHRQLFAEWYLDNTGEEIKEFEIIQKTKPLILQPVQKSLFD